MLASALLALAPASSHGFSVLAHQGIVDESWQGSLLPLLRKRFPQATDEDLAKARSYAYGGSHLADIGYFPLGNELFSKLLHYVRTGDFVSELLAQAATPQEVGFALGALAHYQADAIGHPEGTNRAVAILYPKLARKHGDAVTYADSPSAHLQTELRFDVYQVARRGEVPDLFEHSIGFQVEHALLERAFRKTYGLGLDDLFTSYEVAIGTYRWAFRGLIDEATGIAWRLYRSDIESLEPGVTPDRWVHALTRVDFEKEFGRSFREPGYFARFVAWLGNAVPNVGPFKRLPYKPLPEEVRRLYRDAFRDAADAYRKRIDSLGRRGQRLPNLDLDTGRPARTGEYGLADETYVELVRLLAKDHFAGASPELVRDLREHFQDRDAALAVETCGRERRKALEALSELDVVAQAAKR